MSEVTDFTTVYETVDRAHGEETAPTRRQFVASAAAVVGGLAAFGSITGVAKAASMFGDDPQTILNVAATAEVLATIVNTVGWERNLCPDPVTQRNIAAAAREELIHYQVLVASGGKPLTKRIWVPDAVFADCTSLLNTLQVGDQIFINAYLFATKTFGDAGNGALAVTAAEFMGVEAVHRALARQSLNLLGNDRVFMKYDQAEHAPGAPNQGQNGFEHIGGAVRQLKMAGFGFGVPGPTAGNFYDFDEVSKRTPNDPDLNTFRPDAV